MRVNLSKTLSDAEAILALPGHAAEAMELLSDDRNSFACWERLTELETRVACANGTRGGATSATRRRISLNLTPHSCTLHLY